MRRAIREAHAQRILSADPACVALIDETCLLIQKRGPSHMIQRPFQSTRSATTARQADGRVDSKLHVRLHGFLRMIRSVAAHIGEARISSHDVRIACRVQDIDPVVGANRDSIGLAANGDAHKL